MFVYADNAATTCVSKTALDAMLPCLTENWGNASSLYSFGQRAAELLEESRKTVAACLGAANPREIYFTSCGSESDNQALVSCARLGARKGKKHLISTKFEHHAILHTLKALEKEGFEVTLLDVHEDGVVRVEDVAAAIREDTCCVSVMFANNEVGTIQPIKEIGALCREKGIPFHTDAVQAVGHIPVNVEEMNIDLLSLSGHKFHAPKGIGALYVKKGVTFPNLVHGGGQESGRRAGTENVPGIAGLAMAAQKLYSELESEQDRLYTIKERFISGLKELPDVKINGIPGEDAAAIRKSAPHIVSASFGGVRAEVLLHALEERDIYVSAGSACATHKPEPSRTLQAIGLKKDMLEGTLRFSFSTFTKENEPEEVLAALKDILPELRRFTRR